MSGAMQQAEMRSAHTMPAAALAVPPRSAADAAI